MVTLLRYNVVTKVPQSLRDLGFVAYVEDANHPDGGPCSLSWHLSIGDADRTAAALNYRHLQTSPERTLEDMLRPLNECRTVS